MSDVDELVAFLRARLDEREAAAREAGGEHWHYPADFHRDHMLSDSGEIVMYRDSLRDDMGPHIVLNDPAWVLADVEAKRRIIDEHRICQAVLTADSPHEFGCVTCHSDFTWGLAGEGYCTTLRLLALPCADHEDYRPEWAPE